MAQEFMETFGDQMLGAAAKPGRDAVQVLISHLSDKDASQGNGAAQFPSWTLWWGQS